jgi:hypothetical protein
MGSGRGPFSMRSSAVAFQETWFIFEVPVEFEAPELWLSKKSWLARNLYGWETSPLHDKAVFSLDQEQR